MARRTKRPRRKPPSKKLSEAAKWALLIILPLAAILAHFAVIEAGLRLWDRGVPEMVVPSGIEHPPYYNNPGRTIRAKVFGMHYRYAINSHGMRGPERPKKKPAGTRRILFLGDSLVFGAMVADDRTLPVELERRLGAFGRGNW